MKRSMAWCFLILLLATTTAHAEAPPWGPRAGFSIEPDQFVFGVHAKALEIFPGWAVQPNTTLGLGNDVTTWQLNGDVVYLFPELESYHWGWFAGGGLTWANFWSNGTHNGEIGLSILGGVSYIMSNENRLNLELRFGIDDIPEFILTLGYWFF